MIIRREIQQACLPAFEYIDQHLPEFIEDLIRITEVAAPPYKEQQRARFMSLLFEPLGFTPVIDEIGNVLVSVLSNGGPHVVLSAHLDTVFSFEEIHVKRNGSLYYAPGISDDGSGLAALLYLCRAFRHARLPLKGSLTLLATVGEEGLGNLRGVKHYFSNQKSKTDYFISLDGCDAERLVTAGLGSKRIRVTLHGPGGHSWADAGLPNPIHAAGDLLSRINRLSLPAHPKTTINVGIIGGGTSINAIPTEMHCDIDLRSESDEELDALDRFVQQCLNEISAHTPDIRSTVQILGERPSGVISTDHPLIRKTISANEHFSLPVKTDTGSTDSNIPLALSIPAVTLGVGGKCGKVHTPEEWYDVTDVERGLKRTALLIIDLLHETS